MLKRIKDLNRKEILRIINKLFFILIILNVLAILISAYIYIFFGISLGFERIVTLVMITSLLFLCHMMLSFDENYTIY